MVAGLELLNDVIDELIRVVVAEGQVSEALHHLVVHDGVTDGITDVLGLLCVAESILSADPHSNRNLVDRVERDQIGLGVALFVGRRVLLEAFFNRALTVVEA